MNQAFLTKTTKMKKLFLLMVVAIISQSTFSQFGVQAGLTMATLKFDDLGDVDKKTKIGFTAGVFNNMPLSTNIIFRPGLNFTQKGGKFEESGEKATFTFNYLELPLDFIYKAPGGFFVGAGPTLGYGLSGKVKYSGSGIDDEEDLEFGSDEDKDDLKAFEFSGNLLAGYQISNGIFISVNYNFGFSNLSFDNDVDVKNSYIGIRIGKVIGAKK